MTQIQVESHPNLDAHTFHTRTPLISGKRVWMTHNGLLTGTETGLAELMLKIPGVVSVDVDRYQVQIIKAPLFAWEEISPAVLELLAAFVP